MEERFPGDGGNVLSHLARESVSLVTRECIACKLRQFCLQVVTISLVSVVHMIRIRHWGLVVVGTIACVFGVPDDSFGQTSSPRA